MNELINELDNWSLFQLFGGIGIVLSAVIVFGSKIINQRIVHKWQTSSEKKIEGLKGEINRNNSVVTTLTQQYGANYQKLLDKRIEATELFWGGIIDTKSRIPSVVSLTYEILVDEELSVETLNKMKSGFGLQIENLPVEKFISEVSSISDKISKCRPFISEHLWILLYAYQGFICRTVYLLYDGYSKKDITIWKEDSGVNQILSTVLSDKEIEYIFSLRVHAYKSMLQLLKTRF